MSTSATTVGPLSKKRKAGAYSSRLMKFPRTPNVEFAHQEPDKGTGNDTGPLLSRSWSHINSGLQSGASPSLLSSTISQLTIHALSANPEGLQLQEVFDWIRLNYPGNAEDEKKTKNGISAALNSGFKVRKGDKEPKLSRREADKGAQHSGYIWTLRDRNAGTPAIQMSRERLNGISEDTPTPNGVSNSIGANLSPPRLPVSGCHVADETSEEITQTTQGPLRILRDSTSSYLQQNPPSGVNIANDDSPGPDCIVLNTGAAPVTQQNSSEASLDAAQRDGIREQSLDKPSSLPPRHGPSPEYNQANFALLTGSTEPLPTRGQKACPNERSPDVAEHEEQRQTAADVAISEEMRRYVELASEAVNKSPAFPRLASEQNLNPFLAAALLGHQSAWSNYADRISRDSQALFPLWTSVSSSGAARNIPNWEVLLRAAKSDLGMASASLSPHGALEDVHHSLDVLEKAKKTEREINRAISVYADAWSHMNTEMENLKSIMDDLKSNMSALEESVGENANYTRYLQEYLVEYITRS